MTPKQTKVYKLLTSGSRYTVVDIALKAHVGDPRSVIRNLRKQGVIVSDEWIHNPTSSFKRFWIDPALQPTGLLERLQKGGAI